MWCANLDRWQFLEFLHNRCWWITPFFWGERHMQTPPPACPTPHSSSTQVKTHAYDVTGYVTHLNHLMTVRAKCFLEVKRFSKHYRPLTPQPPTLILSNPYPDILSYHIHSFFILFNSHSDIFFYYQPQSYIPTYSAALPLNPFNPLLSWRLSRFTSYKSQCEDFDNGYRWSQNRV